MTTKETIDKLIEKYEAKIVKIGNILLDYRTTEKLVFNTKIEMYKEFITDLTDFKNTLK